jgi:DNA-binding response OmpR family regulator
MKKILIVDDDAEIRSHLTEVLRGGGYETDEASSGSEATAKASAGQYDLILMDMIMPRGGGADALVELRKTSPRSRIIVITAFATVENAVDAMKRGACDYIAKPFKIEELLTRVRRVLEEARVEECVSKDLDAVLSAFSNPIRTKIIRLILAKKSMRLMELARELGIEDHTKVIFHLKILKQAGIIAQDSEKSYILTGEGDKAAYCLKILYRHLAD